MIENQRFTVSESQESAKCPPFISYMGKVWVCILLCYLLIGWLLHVLFW